MHKQTFKLRLVEFEGRKGPGDLLDIGEIQTFEPQETDRITATVRNPVLVLHEKSTARNQPTAKPAKRRPVVSHFIQDTFEVLEVDPNRREIYLRPWRRKAKSNPSLFSPYANEPTKYWWSDWYGYENSGGPVPVPCPTCTDVGMAGQKRKGTWRICYHDPSWDRWEDLPKTPKWGDRLKSDPDIVVDRVLPKHKIVRLGFPFKESGPCRLWSVSLHTSWKDIFSGTRVWRTIRAHVPPFMGDAVPPSLEVPYRGLIAGSVRLIGLAPAVEN
jgi:hypothetical protein